jgi:hypothetical protein
VRWLPVVAAIVVAAFVLRTVLVLALRPWAPRAAAFVDRWWVWSPLAVILIATTLWIPWLGLVAALAAVIVIVRDPNLERWVDSHRQSSA